MFVSLTGNILFHLSVCCISIQLCWTQRIRTTRFLTQFIPVLKVSAGFKLLVLFS